MLQNKGSIILLQAAVKLGIMQLQRQIWKEGFPLEVEAVLLASVIIDTEGNRGMVG